MPTVFAIRGWLFVPYFSHRAKGKGLGVLARDLAPHPLTTADNLVQMFHVHMIRRCHSTFPNNKLKSLRRFAPKKIRWYV